MLQLHFGLATNNVEDLQARVAKGERISPREMAAKYSGDPASAGKLARWLTQQGFRAVETSADFTSVYATAAVGQIEKSLGVTMQSVTHRGQTKPAATTPPSLPRDVGEAVIAIDGLQPWAHVVKHPILLDRSVRAASAAASREPAYKIYDILKAYDAHGLEVPGKGRVTGKGQTIAILIDTLPLKSDVQAFWQRSGLSIDQSQLQLSMSGAATPAAAA